MPIIYVQVSEAGLSNVYPAVIYIHTNDTLGAVLAPGYLTQSAEAGTTYTNKQMAVVYTTDMGAVLLQVQTPALNPPIVSLALVSPVSTTVTLTAAEVDAAYATPQLLLNAPGAGRAIMITKMSMYTNVSTAFAGGGPALLQYNATVHGGGVEALSATIPAADVTAAASQLYSLNGATSSALTAITNQGIYFSNTTGPFTGGTGSSLTFTIQYTILNALV
jgi:hypothetical protein